MLRRLEIVKLVITAKLASDFISLHCNCFTYDRPDTTTAAQRILTVFVSELSVLLWELMTVVLHIVLLSRLQSAVIQCVSG